MLIKSNNKIEKRLLDPEIVHRIWLGIVSLSSRKNEDYSDYNNITIEKKCLIEFLKNPLKNDNENLIDNNGVATKLIEQAINERLVILLDQKHTSSEETRKLTNGINEKDNETDENDNDNSGCMLSLPHEHVIYPSHDWYCFECHRIFNEEKNSLLECQRCWRVYHQNCVQLATDFTNNILTDDTINKNSITSTSSNENSTIIKNYLSFTCPICILTEKYAPYSVGSRHFDQQEFNQILTYTYTRFKAKASHQILHSLLELKLLFPSLNDFSSMSIFSSEIASPKINQIINGMTREADKKILQTSKDIITKLSVYYLSYKPVDLTIIEERLSTCKYKSIGEFFGDCLNLRHMLEIVVCAGAEQTSINQRRIRDSLLRMLEATRYELKEMIGCVDCYRNSNQQEDKLWFCWPCDPPHTLVFAKQKGYPYWPAKVIYPRNSDEIESCNQLDVRFFGSNHERSIIDKSNIKDINSSLIELNILKPIPSLDKALLELRNYRELLEKKEKIAQRKRINNLEKILKKNKLKNKKNNQHSNKEKCNSILKNGEIGAIMKNAKSKNNKDSDKNVFIEDFMTEESSNDQIEQEDTKKINTTEEPKFYKNNENNDVTDIDIDSSVNNENFKKKIELSTKKNRGRPLKDSTKPKIKNVKKTLSNRIRRKKIIYSPNSSERIFQKDTSPASSIKSKRGRKPKKLFHTNLISSSNKSVDISGLKRNRKFTSLNKRNESRMSTLTNTTTTSNEKISTPNINNNNNNSNISPKTSRSLKLAYQYQKKKREIEKERQLIKARRKLEIETPKHIPPVVATKSTPTVTSTTKPFLKQNPTINSTNLTSQPVNGFSSYNEYQYQYITVNNDSYLIKSEMDTNLNNSAEIKLNAVQLEITNSTNAEDYKPPSSILKPLNSEGETDEDKGDECSQNIEIEGKKLEDNQNQNLSDSIQPNNITIDDDDDEEPYLYDDEQLEEDINYYLEYQKEKELQQQKLNYFQQQQSLHQQELVQRINNLNTKSIEKVNKTNGFTDLLDLPLKKYIDFSTASIYAPTKKNQNLVNAYLHHVHTNSNKIPQHKNDYLANYIVKRNESEHDETNMSPRKRGRPPKNSESGEHVSKVKCVLEKSYLQDSACNRACLTNNVKAFKKFRDFVETEKKTEITDLKRELEESKQQIYRFTNKIKELEEIIKNERDLNKRYDPEVVKQMEERYKQEISNVKRKQWCILCEAEANYFCCFNINYCSPECQLKHWKSGHQFDCTRKNNNNIKKPD